MRSISSEVREAYLRLLLRLCFLGERSLGFSSSSSEEEESEELDELGTNCLLCCFEAKKKRKNVFSVSWDPD
jgi:hypothetical protein